MTFCRNKESFSQRSFGDNPVGIENAITVGYYIPGIIIGSYRSKAVIMGNSDSNRFIIPEFGTGDKYRITWRIIILVGKNSCSI